ncbi:sensor histidine kinase [Sulfuricella denitrificans skB26]|uniref:histidine kinase n=1 Tax=Sulfuricella denitrificans (strain DSM 22764 / NBRC 105220 / skB26) TaxID=1163617 RepID=S6AAN1_SULDS|nr:ATP-binding protein [Sulfuricella denitrificans]BAN36105.1 sensor histidine kinase [Sulfuricella denitrificans skB26]
MEITPLPFDRELNLQELLTGVSLERLGGILKALLGGDFRLVGADGRCLLGSEEPYAQPRRAEIHHDLDLLGQLESASADETRLSATAAMIELMLRLSARYHMAAELHIETVHEDFAALQQKHAALTESEARYKALSGELEARVREQIKIIESAQRQLYQAEKLASIGQLAAGVAHEINNPIGFIRSNLSTAQQYVSKLGALESVMQTGNMSQFQSAWKEAGMAFLLEDFTALLGESVDGADRVTKIVSDLKGFSNVDQAEAEIVDLNDNLRFACNMLAGQTRDRVELVMELGILPKIMCLPGHLNQVFLNLLLNAAQAIADQGRIEVRSEVAGSEIHIRISDNGCGIPEKNLDRLFDPFFTTRQVGSGTGLGLTVCRDIVQAHGGRIEVKSKEGMGTTFTVILPAG